MMSCAVHMIDAELLIAPDARKNRARQ